MADILSASFQRALLLGVNAWFGGAYTAYPTEYDKIFEIYNDAPTKSFIDDVGMYGLGLVPLKAEGNPITYDSMQQTFVQRYAHLTYGLGFKISREAVEDNLYMELAQQRSKALAWSMAQTKENIGANILNRAFNTAYVGADGLCLANAAHLLGKGGTFSNIPAGGGVDISEKALEQAIIDIQLNFLNDAGLKIQIRPDRLIIPPALEFEVKRILNSDLQYDTANNAINAIKTMGMFPGGVHVNHFLTSTSQWNIITNCPDGLKWFNRRTVEIAQDEEFDTETTAYKVTWRGCAGWTDPRCIYASQGA